MISTGGTLIAAAEILQERGTVEVYACGTHPVFAPGAVDMVVNSQIKELVVTNTIPVSEQALKSGKIQVLSIAPLLGEAIRRINGNQSVSELFN